jgi:phosphopantetheinyl transferase
MHVSFIDKHSFSNIRHKKPVGIFEDCEIEDSYSSSYADHNERLAARYATKIAARGYGNKETFVITHDKSGAPEIKGRPDLRCSLSHAVGCGAGAVSDHAVGIDLEWIKPRDISLHSVIAGDTEWGVLPVLSEEESITLLWTIKESVLKATRQGFAISPTHARLLSCTVRTGEVALYASIVSLEEKLWNVFSQRVGGFILSIAHEQKYDETIIYHWN